MRKIPKTIWVLQDTSTLAERRAQMHTLAGEFPIAVRLQRVADSSPELVDEIVYTPGRARMREFREQLVLELLARNQVSSGVVVIGSRLARGGRLVPWCKDRRLSFVLELPAPGVNGIAVAAQTRQQTIVEGRLKKARWRSVDIAAPGSAAKYELADLGIVSLADVQGLQCLALSWGGITDYRRSIAVGIASLPLGTPLEVAAHLLGWTRWALVLSRRAKKQFSVSAHPIANSTSANGAARVQLLLNLPIRTNLQIARKQDDRAAGTRSEDLFERVSLNATLISERRVLNTVELFAGAGGLGLGFLRAGDEKCGFRLLFSGEVNPVFAHTLRANHEYLRETGLVAPDRIPTIATPVDLREPSVVERVQSLAHEWGGVDVLIGGPPCQGFSSANRNSWSSKNPNNRLVDTFLDYVDRLKPRVLLMENVQGILWTPRHDTHDELSVAEHVARRLSRGGYSIYPKLIDAAWFGVPQHRNRFFLLGIHRDLDYSPEAFGAWGPFPQPTHGPTVNRSYTTVREAIADLPAVGNGAGAELLNYRRSRAKLPWFLSAMRSGAPTGFIWDHVTSKHAEYVIERYQRIPAGENWSSITEMMTNYAAVERTHSNIYRRLAWDQPSITIGHYRKAMLIHPDQDRGLSLREASRLQSFPDWFRFAGSETSLAGGLGYKQQQLANAVAPLVAQAIGEMILKV